MTDKSVLDFNLKKGISLSKIVKIINRNIGIITLIISLFSIILSICYLIFKIGQVSYWGISVSSIINDSFSIEIVLSVILPISVYIALCLRIIYCKTKKKYYDLNNYGKSNNIKNILLNNSLNLVIFVYLIISMRKIYKIYGFSYGFLWLSLIEFVIFVFLLGITNIFIKTNRCKKFVVFMTAFKYNMVYFFINFVLSYLFDNVLNGKNIGNYEYIEILRMTPYIIIYISILPISLSVLMCFMINIKIDFNNKYKRKICIDKKIFYLISIMFVYIVVTSFVLGYMGMKDKTIYNRIDYIDNQMNEIDRGDEIYVVIYETNSKYIVANLYVHEAKKISDYVIPNYSIQYAINNEELRYINKSENLVLKKVELDNVKVKSKID